jgi:hypothetical protein
MRILLVLAPLVLLSLGLAGPASAAECGSSHAKVGWEAKLVTHHHGVTGTVKIVDDCTLRVENFSYDGKGVDVRLVTANNEKFKKHVKLTDDLHGKGAYDKVTFDVKLPEGMNLDDVDYVSFWCVAFAVSFADGKLSKS